jgi:hypothetical protein
MAVAAPKRAQRRREGATGLGEGRGVPEAAGRAAVRKRLSPTTAPAAGLRASAVGGAAAARGPPASAALPSLSRASRGGLRQPQLVSPGLV